MFAVRLYILSILIALNYANFNDIFPQQSEQRYELKHLERLQGILTESTDTYQKAKEKLETASSFAKELPDFLHRPHQLLNDALSKFQNFFKKPADVIKQFEDSFKIVKELTVVIEESLQRLFEILSKTEEMTSVLQQISQKEIVHVTGQLDIISKPLQEGIETVSGFTNKLPGLLNYPQQLVNGALSQIEQFVNKPVDVIKQFEDNLNIAKKLVDLIEESLQKLFKILFKTEKITMILQEISEKGSGIEEITDDGNEGVTVVVVKESIEELVKGSIEQPKEDNFTEIIQVIEIVHNISEAMETAKEPVVIFEGIEITGDKPHHSDHHTHHNSHHHSNHSHHHHHHSNNSHSHHKPSESTLCNCDSCSCEKSCRSSKGEIIRYIPCQRGTVCCIKKPKTGTYTEMEWEIVLQVSIDHLRKNLENVV